MSRLSDIEGPANSGAVVASDAMTGDADIPPIQFATGRGGARLAYQIYGEGPPMVTIPPTAQNIEAAWEWPAIRAMFERFGRFSRHLLFDKRGTGASDRVHHMSGLDERVDDLRAVMDAAGLARAWLFGASEGGPVTLMFAATYPDRVNGIIINGSGARTMPTDLSDGERAGAMEGFAAASQLWGTPESPIVDLFAPSLAGDEEFRIWHQRYERLSASPNSLRELLEIDLDIDVREIAPLVDVPTLILHRTDDQVVSVEYARELAKLMSHATLIEQPGNDHFNYAGDTDTWMDEIERFITGAVTSAPISSLTKSKPRIVTLGRFAVIVDGEEVPTSAWGSRLARQLTKRLVAARGWPVTRDELFDLLWPDETDRHRLGARLSVQLSAVRRVLGGGVIADRQSVRLDPDEVETDLDLFFRVETDAEIVDAYVGEFLPEDVYDDWTGPPRDEARARFVSAARRQLAEAVAGQDHGRSAALARRLIDVDRYDSDAHEQLIAALAGMGESGEARRAEEALAEVMAELGI